MISVRSILVLLVLLQTGLVAGAHEHAGPTPSPHAHLHDLLDFVFSHTPDDDDDHDDGGHDDDALYLTALTGPAPAPSADPAEFAIPVAATVSVAAEIPVLSRFPVGLPPSTAGPGRPLYLTQCSFRN